MRAASAATRSGSDDSRSLSGVITNPGTSVLQVTPYGDHASACERASDSSAPLETPYAPLCTNARCACWEVMWMIRPKPRSAMPGPNR